MCVCVCKLPACLLACFEQFQYAYERLNVVGFWAKNKSIQPTETTDQAVKPAQSVVWFRLLSVCQSAALTVCLVAIFRLVWSYFLHLQCHMSSIILVVFIAFMCLHSCRCQVGVVVVVVVAAGCFYYNGRRRHRHRRRGSWGFIFIFDSAILLHSLPSLCVPLSLLLAALISVFVRSFFFLTLTAFSSSSSSLLSFAASSSTFSYGKCKLLV